MQSLGRRKGSRLRICFRVVDDVPEKKGMDLWKQMLSSKCSFTSICGIFLPLNPSTTTVYARSTFYPSRRFTLSLQSAHSLHFTPSPQSAVCSPQSAFYTDRIWNALLVIGWIHQGPRTRISALPAGRPPSVSRGCCWLKSEQWSFVIYRRNTYEQYGGYNLFQNAEF